LALKHFTTKLIIFNFVCVIFITSNEISCVEWGEGSRRLLWFSEIGRIVSAVNDGLHARLNESEERK
jgi:hypothetical protein